MADNALAEMFRAHPVENTYAGQLDKQQIQANEVARMQSLINSQNASTRKTNALLPFDVKKAQWDTSDTVQKAGLDQTLATTKMHNAQADSMSADAKKKMLALGVEQGMQGFKDLAIQGQAMASQGMGGQAAYEHLKGYAVRKLENAKTPEEKQAAQQSLSEFEEIASTSGMRNWTPQQLMQQATKMKETIDNQDIGVIKEKLQQSGMTGRTQMDINSREKIAGMNIGAKTVGKTSNDAFNKLSPDKQYSIAASAVNSKKDPYTGSPLSPEGVELWQHRMNASGTTMNAGLEAKRPPGIDLNAQTGGKVQMTPSPAVPVGVTSAAPSTKEINGVTYVKVPGGWKKQ